jgi:hypothetical protein
MERSCLPMLPSQYQQRGQRASSIVSTILKWLRFKFQIYSLAQQWFWMGNEGMYFTKGSDIKLSQITRMKLF